MLFRLLVSMCRIRLSRTAGCSVQFEEKILKHDWRNGATNIGEIPASFVKEVSNGKADWPIPISLNSTLVNEKWDLVINIGHVVPHEVLWICEP